jgi:hypothetical protein
MQDILFSPLDIWYLPWHADPSDTPRAPLYIAPVMAGKAPQYKNRKWPTRYIPLNAPKVFHIVGMQALVFIIAVFAQRVVDGQVYIAAVRAVQDIVGLKIIGYDYSPLLAWVFDNIQHFPARERFPLFIRLGYIQMNTPCFPVKNAYHRGFIRSQGGG